MGFFTELFRAGKLPLVVSRNPFQGGMGFFTCNPVGRGEGAIPSNVAIPFRVGWGFSRCLVKGGSCGSWILSRNPFQGGMGFFTAYRMGMKVANLIKGRNPFQGGMGFFTPVPPDRLGCKPAEAFRQPQVCPPKTSKKL